MPDEVQGHVEDVGQVPDTTSVFITDLVLKIEGGDIKLPMFQRPFVWRPAQVIELFDSIRLGYPIGSLLFWRTDARLAQQRNIGDFELPETPEKYPTNYVLDGQQRLTAIFGALTYAGDLTKEHAFNVAFDLVESKFINPTGPAEAHWMPLNVLHRMPNYLRWQRQLDQQRPDLVDQADAAYSALRSYAIPVVTIMAPAVEGVATIFERINRTGTGLTLFDLMVAATWSENFLLRDEVESVMAELRAKNFDDISPVALLQVLAAGFRGSANRESILKLREQDAETLGVGITEVAEGMRRAVDFLATDLQIHSTDFLPYERQFTALAHVFRSGPVDARGVDVLRRWFWRTSFSERYRRGGEGAFDEDLKSLVAAVREGADLDGFGRPPDAGLIAATAFRSGTALAAAYAAYLGTWRPRNLVNGATLDVGRSLSAFNRREFHHIFPQAFLRARAVPSDKINSLANICMLSAEQNKTIGSRAPSIYFQQLRQNLGEGVFQQVLASNLIPIEALQAIDADDYEAFLEARAAHVVGRISESL